MRKLSPKGTAASTGRATALRILRHNARQQTREQPPNWHKRGDNEGAIRRCANFAISRREHGKLVLRDSAK